jgi:hypothetical protein
MHDDEGVSESRFEILLLSSKHVEIIQPVQSIARHNRLNLCDLCLLLEVDNTLVGIIYPVLYIKPIPDDLCSIHLCGYIRCL